MFLLSQIGWPSHNLRSGGVSALQQADAFEANGGISRVGAVRAAYAAALSGTSSITISRMIWTRALPGTIAVLAALSLPELSLGAGKPGQTQPVLGQVSAQGALAVWTEPSSALLLAPSEGRISAFLRRFHRCGR